VGGTGIEINGTGSYLLARNDIFVEHPAGRGIIGFGSEIDGFGPLSGATIVKNHIRLQPVEIGADLEIAGILLSGIVFDTYIGQNKIEGDARDAFLLFNASSFEPAADIGFTTLIGNNIAHVRSTRADIFLSEVTHDTVLKGKSRTVIDLGTNNRIQPPSTEGGYRRDQVVTPAGRHPFGVGGRVVASRVASAFTENAAASRRS